MESIPLITTQKLIHDLTQLGLRSGQTVLVHTSMKSLGGYVVGDAPAVVDALMNVLTPDGTLIMPTHSTNNTDPSTWRRPPFPERNWKTFRKTMPPYRPLITPSNRMGAINESFRTYPGVLRSSHPAFSFSAWGRHATFVVANQSLNNSVAEESPTGRLYALDGWVLLLGVGYDHNTSLHLADFRANYPGKVCETNSSAMIQNGERVWVTYYDEAIAEDDFVDIGNAFEAETSEVAVGKVAEATTRLMRQRPLVDFAVQWMEANRPASLKR